MYVAWASHEDEDPWYGWVMAYQYNGTAFTQSAAFNTTPNVGKGGVWMSGAAPAVDSSGNLYVSTGNGVFDANSSPPGKDYGDSLLQLTASLVVNQYFTPTDQLADYNGDQDFGAGGAAVLADLPFGGGVTHALVCGGKDGTLYVLNGICSAGWATCSPCKPSRSATRSFRRRLCGTAMCISHPSEERWLHINSRRPAQFGLVSMSAHTYQFPGATPSVSASGTQNGVVWALDNSSYCTEQSPSCGPAVLHAYDATDLATELWNSSTNPLDVAGNAVKFTVPTVANGRVYVGTRGNNAAGRTARPAPRASSRSTA